MQANPKDIVMQWITSKWIAEPIFTIVDLKIPDILKKQPLNIEELSKQTNTIPEKLLRIIRLLTSLGIFSIDKEGYIHLEITGDLLTDENLAAIARMMSSEWHNKAWAKLTESLQNTDSAFELAHGKNCMEWFSENHYAIDDLSKANAIKSKISHSLIIDHYDFSQTKEIVDLGGGYGGLAFSILEKYHDLSMIIADLPFVVDTTKKMIQQNKLENRCKTSPVDFFKSIPEIKDTVLLSHILHDWSDEKCKIILKNCCQAMKKGTKLLIVEMILPETDEFHISKILDIEMLVMGEGKERTETEFRELIEACGLTMQKIIPTSGDISLIECIKL